MTDYYLPTPQEIQEVIYNTFMAIWNLIQPFLPYLILFIIFVLILKFIM